MDTWFIRKWNIGRKRAKIKFRKRCLMMAVCVSGEWTPGSITKFGWVLKTTSIPGEATNNVCVFFDYLL